MQKAVVTCALTGVLTNPNQHPVPVTTSEMAKSAKDAFDAGATVTMEVADQFWGDRFGSVQDPFGHSWSIATHVEDVPPEEMAERAKKAMAAMSS